MIVSNVVNFSSFCSFWHYVNIVVYIHGCLLQRVSLQFIVAFCMMDISMLVDQAGNILVDANGAVKLGDFGVSACMFDTGDRQRSRNTFVGTPCW